MKRYVVFYRFIIKKVEVRIMLGSSKICSLLTFVSFSFSTKIRKGSEVEQLPLNPPDITGEVYSVEEQWLFINGDVYVDITEANMVDEEEKQLRVKEIKEGDHVVVWITESEIIKTYPALGTANYIQRRLEF
jgi:hypothetical protein